MFRIWQFYICLVVFYNINCLQFFICILLSVLFYVFLSLPQLVLYDVLKLKSPGVHAPELPTSRTLSGDSDQKQTRPDERGEEAGTLHSGSSKGYDKPGL